MLNPQELGQALFESDASKLFRLETLDHYDVSSDGGNFQGYMAGKPARISTWPDAIREQVARGLHTYRVHVVRSPLSDYLRYECEWGYVGNGEAGEHIRIIDTAEQSKPDGIPDYDFWLIDDDRLILMHYNPDGTFEGASFADPELIPEHIAARETAWAAGVDFTEYWAKHPEYHRDRKET